MIDYSSLEQITLESVEEHIFELFVTRVDAEHDHGLGFIQRKDGILQLTVADHDLEITQSLSLLNSKIVSSTTGAVAWKVSPLLVEWLLTPRTVLHSLIRSQTTVVELGSGIAGIVASIIGPKISRYLATDQAHLLKLARQNIERNLIKPNTKTRNHETHIETVEYDWEYIKETLSNLSMIKGIGDYGLVIACDTIYNDFLIPHFVNALSAVLREMGPGARVILAQQLRSDQILEAVLNQLLNAGFVLWNIPENKLSNDLQHGFVIHYLEQK